MNMPYMFIFFCYQLRIIYDLNELGQQLLSFIIFSRWIYINMHRITFIFIYIVYLWITIIYLGLGSLDSSIYISIYSHCYNYHRYLTIIILFILRMVFLKVFKNLHLFFHNLFSLDFSHSSPLFWYQLTQNEPYLFHD